MSKRLTGLNPLAYMGDEAPTPPNLVLEKRDPTIQDKRYYNIGTLWVNNVPEPQNIWMLVDLINNEGTWIQLYPCMPLGNASFITDDGTATMSNFILNVPGDTVIETFGSGNTLTVSISEGTDGQVLIGATGSIPQWGNITSSGGTITISEGPNTINLEAVGVGATDYVTDSGTANPAGNVIQILGGDNINTEGATNIVTINLDDNVDIPGTLIVQSLDRGVVQSTADGLLFADEGTDGQILISSSSGAPAWANITSTDGSITVTNGSNTIDLSAGSIVGNKSAFLAQLQSSTATSGPSILLGADPSLTTIFDQQGNFYAGDGAGIEARFTASVEGIYQLHLAASIEYINYPANNATGAGQIVTSNRTYQTWLSTYYDSDSLYDVISVSALADMDMGDSAVWSVSYNMGTGAPYTDATIYGDATTTLRTFVSGYLAA